MRNTIGLTKNYVLIDLILIFLSFYVVLDWFPLTTDSPFNKYSWPSLWYIIAWVITSFLFNRYKPLKTQKYFSAVLRLLDTSLIVLILFKVILYFYNTTYSEYVLLSITIGVFVLNYIYLSVYYAYKSAVEYNEFTIAPEERINAQVRPEIKMDEASFSELCETIHHHSGKRVLTFLQSKLDLRSENTKVFSTIDAENLKMTANYHYSAIVQLNRLNDLRGINRTLTVINQKLPDDGLFVCCYESKSTYKQRVLNKYFRGLNYIVYSFDFMIRRIMPRLFFTRRLYYLIKGSKNRIFSKAEVMGRLYCFGFKVVWEKKINNLTYVMAQRVKQPEPVHQRTYGPLIRLRRYGKNAKPFDVFKMRTMHPYSEYLQAHVFAKHKLQEGGKFHKDFRVTTMGRFMRKYWLDELPMIINVLQGDMKLVGVRPLSAHYFSLYSKDLQELRVKFKPGLLPPFYADMPKTLPQIQASEMKYLNACAEKGAWRTDINYFFLILRNIFFKKARSA